MPIEKNNSRHVHLLTVTADLNEFKLGRGNNSHIKIEDISVSRVHTLIKCRNDGFYIEDNNSKFGTSILVRDKLCIQARHKIAVQVGRTIMHVKLTEE